MERLRTQLIGLAMSCPAERESPSCPFEAVRREDKLVRYRWATGLSGAEMEALYAAHRRCSASADRQDGDPAAGRGRFEEIEEVQTKVIQGIPQEEP